MLNHNDTAYVLASASPRRKQLLAYLNLAHTYQYAVETDETIAKEWSPSEAVMRLSLNKALTVLEKLAHIDQTWSNEIKSVAIIAADTIVVRDEHILGKPKDASDAFNMLKSLQGRSHQVFTGLTLLHSSDKAVVNQPSETQAMAHRLQANALSSLSVNHEKVAFGQHGYLYHLNEINEKDTKLFVSYIKSKVTFRPLTDEQIINYINTGDPLDKAGSYGIQGIGSVNIEAIDGDFYSVMGLPLSLLHHLILLSQSDNIW